MNAANFSLAWRAFAVVVLLLLLIGGYAFWLKLDRDGLAKKYYETKNYYENDSTLQRSRDTFYREKVIYKTAPISEATLKGLKAGLAAEMREQLRAEFKGQAARLMFGQRVQQAVAQQLPTVALKDTVVRRTEPTTGQVITKTAKVGTFKDEWLSLTGTVIEGREGQKDSLSVKYFIRNEFDVRAYSRRTGKHWWQFWKPRQAFVDLKNKNPNAITSSMEAVIIEKK